MLAARMIKKEEGDANVVGTKKICGPMEDAKIRTFFAPTS